MIKVKKRGLKRKRKRSDKLLHLRISFPVLTRRKPLKMGKQTIMMM